jgi:transposase
MRPTKTTSGERTIKDIKRKTRKQDSAEEKIRIVTLSLYVAKRCRKESLARLLC